MAKAAFVYEDTLSQHSLRQDHPMRPVRLRHTYELLNAYGAFQDSESLLVTPRVATEEEVRSLHSAEYVSAVQGLSRGLGGFNMQRYGFSVQGDNPIYPGMYDAASLSTGASLVAAELVASKQVAAAFNISGGLHHAAPDHASGFCIFNDPAIAIKYLLDQGLRVVYVDIDAHHGDGVQNVFYGDNRVLTISIHESGQYLFPGTGFVTEMGSGPGEGYAVNVPVYPHTDDEVYLWAFNEVVPPLIRAFAPDVLVTQLGIDSYHNDPLTHLKLTSRGYVQAIREFAGMGIPWLALGGGGYDLSAVARCWTLAYGVMLGVEWPDAIPDGYSAEYGLTTLRDTMALEIPSEVARDARNLAEEGVSAIKARIFPLHALGGQD